MKEDCCFSIIYDGGCVDLEIENGVSSTVKKWVKALKKAKNYQLNKENLLNVSKEIDHLHENLKKKIEEQKKQADKIQKEENANNIYLPSSPPPSSNPDHEQVHKMKEKLQENIIKAERLENKTADLANESLSFLELAEELRKSKYKKIFF